MVSAIKSTHSSSTVADPGASVTPLSSTQSMWSIAMPSPKVSLETRTQRHTPEQRNTTSAWRRSSAGVGAGGTGARWARWCDKGGESGFRMRGVSIGKPAASQNTGGASNSPLNSVRMAPQTQALAITTGPQYPSHHQTDFFERDGQRTSPRNAGSSRETAQARDGIQHDVSVSCPACRQLRVEREIPTLVRHAVKSACASPRDTELQRDTYASVSTALQAQLRVLDLARRWRSIAPLRARRDSQSQFHGACSPREPRLETARARSLDTL